MDILLKNTILKWNSHLIIFIFYYFLFQSHATGKILKNRIYKMPMFVLQKQTS